MYATLRSNDIGMWDRATCWGNSAFGSCETEQHHGRVASIYELLCHLRWILKTALRQKLRIGQTSTVDYK